MMRSFPQVKRCPRGPHIFSGLWVSLAEGGFAEEDTKIGQNEIIYESLIHFPKNTFGE